MLSIGKVTADNADYWERQVAQGRDDYYSGRGESPGRWTGKASAALDLSGEVDGDDYAAVIVEGRRPGSEDKLRSSERGGGRIVAFDLTFSAPKSVSLLYAAADEETARALREAHDEAVAAALGYLEDEACGVRRGAAGAERLPGAGFLSAAYRHRMSRAGDPHLHTHVVTANLAEGPDGRWSALNAAELYSHAKAGGYAYQAHLRAAVRERLPWWQWSDVEKGMAELDSLDPALLREFSRRRQEIEQELEAHGRSGRRSAEKAALSTRAAKDYDVELTDWRADVRARAAEHGLGRTEIAALAGASPAPDASPEEDQLARRLAGPAGLTEKRNSFEPRDAVAAHAAAHRDGLEVERTRSAARRFLKRPEVRGLHGPTAESYTTDDLLRHERAIIESAARRADAAAPSIPPALATEGLSRHSHGLSAEQRAAVLALAESGRGVESIEALAGTGKTTIAGALHDVYEAAGVRVVGAAPTARAARELSERAGIAGATTLARLRIDLETYGGFGRDPAVLIIDEAGMASTREVAAMFAEAERSNVKVIAIGDSGQLASVEAGGWLGSISRRFGAHRLTEVMRQRDPRERHMLARLHAGEAHAYVRHKVRSGELRVFESTADGEASLVADWWRAQSRLSRGEAVMISRDNATRERLNAAARQRMRGAGRLGESVELGGREFAIGDRVIARRNDRGHDVDNGMRATVRAVDPKTGALVVETDASGTRELPGAYAAEHLEHAYALTGHGTQGGTVEWTGATGLPSDFSRNWAYTALSRARGETRIYLVDEVSRHEGERAEIAPREDRVGRHEAAVRMERAMRVRDDEDLALDFIDPPSLPDDDNRPERAEPMVARADEPSWHLGADVERLRSELADLEAKLDSYPHALARRLDAARAERSQSEALAAEARKQVASLGPKAAGTERAFEETKLSEAERKIRAAAKTERDLAPKVPDAKAFERESAPFKGRAEELRSILAARREAHVEAAVTSPGQHLRDALGSPPSDQRGRRTWEKAARAVERYRFEAGLSAETPLGERPSEPVRERAWRDASDELARGQRLLGREAGREAARALGR